MTNLYKAIETKHNATLTNVEDGILVQTTDDNGNLEWTVVQTTVDAVAWLS